MSDILKIIGGWTATAGVGVVVKNLIEHNIGDLKKVDKIMAGIGAFVITSMIADKASEYIDKQIDEGVEFIRKTKKDMEKYYETKANMK